MNTQRSWEALRRWLEREREISLARGRPFRVFLDSKRDELVIIPLESGIERHVGRGEWSRFVEKFNSVENSGYDPLRPGHYARVSFNSSYLVAIVKEARLNRSAS